MSTTEESYIYETQRIYADILTYPKMKEKHLTRPPFRFIHALVCELMRVCEFPPTGTFSEHEMTNAHSMEKSDKCVYIQKLIQVTQTCVSEKIDVSAKQVVCGLEPQKTNILLQKLGIAAKKNKNKDLQVDIHTSADYDIHTDTHTEAYTDIHTDIHTDTDVNTGIDIHTHVHPWEQELNDYADSIENVYIESRAAKHTVKHTHKLVDLLHTQNDMWADTQTKAVKLLRENETHLRTEKKKLENILETVENDIQNEYTLIAEMNKIIYDNQVVINNIYKGHNSDVKA